MTPDTLPVGGGPIHDGVGSFKGKLVASGLRSFPFHRPFRCYLTEVLFENRSTLAGEFWLFRNVAEVDFPDSFVQNVEAITGLSLS
jgi:hypothetical protein